MEMMCGGCQIIFRWREMREPLGATLKALLDWFSPCGMLPTREETTGTIEDAIELQTKAAKIVGT